MTLQAPLSPSNSNLSTGTYFAGAAGIEPYDDDGAPLSAEEGPPPAEPHRIAPEDLPAPASNVVPFPVRSIISGMILGPQPAPIPTPTPEETAKAAAANPERWAEWLKYVASARAAALGVAKLLENAIQTAPAAAPAPESTSVELPPWVTDAPPHDAYDDAPQHQAEVPHAAPAAARTTRTARAPAARSARAPSPEVSIRLFRDDMDAAGLSFKGKLRADDGMVRFHVDGDSKGSLNGWYFLHTTDGWPNGEAGSWRLNGPEPIVKWVASGTDGNGPSGAERKAMKERQEAAQRQREAEEAERQAKAAARAVAMWEAAKPADDTHPYLVRKGVKAFGLRVGTWIKEWVDEHGEVHTKTVPNALLVPIHENAKSIVSLQAIFDGKALGRDKDFLSGGRKRGCYFVIGAPAPNAATGILTVIICEGYSTGASIHMATGALVVVAFDANNMAHVAKLFRKRLPEARIVMAGDNDAWTDRPVKNPGATAARQAAKEINGIVAIPQFKSVESKPTDFNDLHMAGGLDHAAEGLAEVKRQVLAAIAAAEQRQAGEEPQADAAGAGSANDASAAEARQHAAIDPSGHFGILGYSDDDQYHIYHRRKRLIQRVSPRDFSSDHNLNNMAPWRWWQMNFPVKGGGCDKTKASNWFIQTATARGVFDPTKIRGRGAWIDRDRCIFHFGNQLAVDGIPVDVDAIKSEYIYPIGRTLPPPAEDALSDADGQRIIDVAKQFRWVNPGSALLLCGWIALAPVCGALKWRPHAWLTGGAGCGKTTILRDFAKHLLSGISLMVQGYSTEAGIRQKLRNDAIPVLFDESEQQSDQDSKRIQSILGLARQASSESDALTLKGTIRGDGMEFLIRSMFLLSSISIGIKYDADHDRIAKLHLRPKHEREHREKWPITKKALGALLKDKTLPARLLRRMLDTLPTVLQNIDTFIEVMSNRLGSPRDGDQYGTLLAGAWSIAHSGLATRDDAEKLVDAYNWSAFLDDAGGNEPEKVINSVLRHCERLPHGTQIAMSELIRIAAGQNQEDGSTTETKITAAEANRILGHNGLKVFIEKGQSAADGKLLIERDNSKISGMLAGTPFENGWWDQVKRLKGAGEFRHEEGPTKGEWRKQRFASNPERCLSVPLSMIFDGQPSEPDSSPSEDSDPNDEPPL
ncbi:MAG: toprim domain-containing protein [Stellaceae bacterium]